MTDKLNKDEKLVFEAGDNGEVVEATDNLQAENVRANEVDDDSNVQMSNGEACGIVEFEGKRINTCKGEKIVDSGYTNPDK